MSGSRLQKFSIALTHHLKVGILDITQQEGGKMSKSNVAVLVWGVIGGAIAAACSTTIFGALALSVVLGILGGVAIHFLIKG